MLYASDGSRIPNQGVGNQVGDQVRVTETWVNAGNTMNVGEILTIARVNDDGGVMYTRSTGQKVWSNTSQYSNQTEPYSTNTGYTDLTDYINSNIIAKRDDIANNLYQDEMYKIIHYDSVNDIAYAEMLGHETIQYTFNMDTYQIDWEFVSATFDRRIYNHFVGIDIYRTIVSISDVDQRFRTGETSQIVSMRVENDNRTALLLNGITISWHTRGILWDFEDDPVQQDHPDTGIHEVSYYTIVSTPVAPIIIQLNVTFNLNFYDADHLQTYTSGFQGFPIAPGCEAQMTSAELGDIYAWDDYLPSLADDTKAYRLKTIVKPINIYNANQLHQVQGANIGELADRNEANLASVYQQRARTSHKGVYTYTLVVVLEGLNSGRYRTANEYYLAHFHPKWTYTGS